MILSLLEPRQFERLAARKGPLWEALLAIATTDAAAEPLVPAAANPYGNLDAHLARALRQRVLIAALLARMTGESRWEESAWRQLDAMIDPRRYPAWRDSYEMTPGADLRTGSLASTLAIAWSWLDGLLADGRRSALVAALDERAIQPYLSNYAADVWYFNTVSNWTVVVVGGLGVCGRCLGAAHPESERLVALADRLLPRCLDAFGPQGEFNESPFYAQSVRELLWCLAALRSPWVDRAITVHPLPAFCRWQMHATLPPGRVIASGDGPPGAAPDAAVVAAAVAAATRDRGLQAWWLAHRGHGSPHGLAQESFPLEEFLWADPDLAPGPIEEPLGRAFPAHGGLVVSRSGWDSRSEACVVWGKGSCELHGHHDAGQVGIEAWGRGLIVDLGTCGYPADYFGPARWHYYMASSRGHNVPCIDGAEAEGRASLLASAFEPARGGWWQHDLTASYPGAERVVRTVIHLLPGIVVVLDEIEAGREAELTVRWHPVHSAIPDADGQCAIIDGEAALAARLVRPDGGPLAFRSGHHAFTAPFDQRRQGDPLPQRHEPWFEATTFGRSLRLLSLFAVAPHGGVPLQWCESGHGGWRSGEVTATCTVDRLTIANDDGRHWTIAP